METIKLTVVLILLGQFLDILTTYIGISSGLCKEENPVQHVIGWFWFMFLKVIYTILVAWMVQNTNYFGWDWAFVAVSWCPVPWNVYVLRKKYIEKIRHPKILLRINSYE
jgi:hypothetical protein